MKGDFMKKEYERPSTEITALEPTDIIKTSGGRDYSGEWDADW